MDADPDALPAFLDPLLDYLHSVLPPPLDDILTTVISHGFTLARSLFSLGVQLFSSDPSTWDAQTILPALISVLAAYLALLSVYRTTRWMISTSLWFVKWGSILGALFAGTGYFMGNANAGERARGQGPLAGLANLGFGNVGQGAGGGIARAVGGMVWDAMNGHQDSNTRTRARSREGAAANAGKRKGKPGAKDSFRTHEEFRYQEERDYARARGAPDVDEDADDAGPVDAKKIMGQIVGFASKMGWMDAMKGVVEGATKAAGGDADATDKEEGGSRKKQPRRKAKTGKGTSSR